MGSLTGSDFNNTACTKVKIAAQADRYENIGRDLVNHCINDILVQGARPLFFMDYIASSKTIPERIAAIVTSMADACREANMPLLGGETARLVRTLRHHGLGTVDISDNELYGCDFKKALGAITAKAYVMPGQTDLYFPPEDSEFEVAHMPNAKFVPVPSITFNRKSCRIITEVFAWMMRLPGSLPAVHLIRLGE